MEQKNIPAWPDVGRHIDHKIVNLVNHSRRLPTVIKLQQADRFRAGRPRFGLTPAARAAQRFR